MAAPQRLKVGLIGAGPRGRGAAKDCVTADADVDLVAIADLFPDKMEEAKGVLKESLGPNYKVPDDACFVGFDAYQKLLVNVDVDLVILTAPPGFRPAHLRAAAEAGKHVFAEKPVAVDAAGVRSVLETASSFDQKKLCAVVGTQRRHTPAYVETIKRIHDGAIGEIVGGVASWCQGYVRMFPRQPDWSDLEWQMRNWWYFCWISGDHIVEQHIHNIDVINWAMRATPVKAYGSGGRQVRTDKAYGHTFDHFAVEYEYPNGARVTSICRQIDGTDPRIGEWLRGTKGSCAVHRARIDFADGSKSWRFNDKEKRVGFVQEHADLIAAVRSGAHVNELKRMAETNLTSVMGRMSAYTGKEVTWEQAMNSREDLFPATLDFAASYATPPVPVPGKTQLI
jgi:myo-inositol 2-dehydrogenase / D-chiro-inositol 1-dehydrogenase